MPKKQVKFCGILKWLEIHDPDLYAAIEDLCIQRIFNPKGTKGISFLYPKDYRKQIIDETYGDSPENAIQMLQACIVTDRMDTYKDFETKKDDIPNALRQKIGIKSVSASEVILEGGLTLKKEDSFIPFQTKDNLSVWTMTGKGMIPIDGLPSEGKYNRKRVRGSGETDNEIQEKLNFINAKNAEFLYQLTKKSNHIPQVEAVCSMCNWGAKNPEFDKLHKYASLGVFETFVIWVKMMDYPTFTKWRKETNDGMYCSDNDLFSEYKTYYDSYTKQLATSKLDEEIAKKQNIRSGLINNKAFKATLSQNMLIEYKDDFQSAHLDEARYMMYCHLHNIFESSFEINDRKAACGPLFNFVEDFIKQDITSKNGLTLMNSKIQGGNDSVGWVCGPFTMARGTDFLFIQIPLSKLDTPALGVSAITESNITTNTLYNMEKNRDILYSKLKPSSRISKTTLSNIMAP